PPLRPPPRAAGHRLSGTPRPPCDRPPVRASLPRQGRDAVPGDESLGGQVLAPALDAAGRRRARLLPALGYGDVSPLDCHGLIAAAGAHRRRGLSSSAQVSMFV